MRQVYPMLRSLATACLVLTGGSCGSSPQTVEPARETAAVRPADSLDDGAPLVVFLGDSLTAGYGLEQEQAFPALVRELLRESGVPVRVVNAGVSGDTSAGGLRRLEWLLQQEPDVVVVGLGANDALRGQPPETTEENLRRIVTTIRGRGAQVLLLGMRIPTNYGPAFTEGFAGIYPRIARDLDVPLVPFLLEGVGGVASLNLPDGIHPNAEGHRKVAETVEKELRPLVASGRGA